MSSHPDMNKVGCVGPSAMRIKQKRVDFISALPLEVVAEHIVPKIMGRDGKALHLKCPTNYFAVCKEWSKRLAICDPSIHFYICGRWRSEIDWKRVETVAPHIKVLSVTACNKRAMLNLASYGPFLTLCDLTITLTGHQKVWVKVLGSMTNLKRLHVKCDKNLKSLQLYEFLTECPRLIDLTLTYEGDFRLHEDIYGNAQYPNLRYLGLRYGPSGRYIAANLLPHFPGLQALRLLSPPTCFNDLHMIIQYCPRLQQLILGSASDASCTANALSHQGVSEGLQLLSIRGRRYDEQDVARFLNEHGATLQSLQLHSDVLYHGHVITLPNHPVILNQLRTLQYSGAMDHNMVIWMRWIILRAPNLEVVEGVGGPVHGPILDDLIDRPVKKINLGCFPWFESGHQYRFLTHHAQLGKESTLQVTKCRVLHLPTHEHGLGWIYLIAELKQLTSLELSLGYQARANLPKLEEFLRHVSRGCNSLEKVTLDLSVFGSPGEWILPLSKRVHLKNLVIISDMISNHALSFLERFQHLDSLHLKLKRFDTKAIAHLNRELPCLTCTPQK